jgi:chaperone modulatory protein CbpM
VKPVSNTSEVRLLQEGEWLAVDDVCRLCAIDMDLVIEFVELGVIRSRGAQPLQWCVPAEAIGRLRVASRLMRDLGVNVSGAALAIELLENRRELERRIEQLERLAQGSP